MLGGTPPLQGGDPSPVSQRVGGAELGGCGHACSPMELPVGTVPMGGAGDTAEHPPGQGVMGVSGV